MTSAPDNTPRLRLAAAPRTPAEGTDEELWTLSSAGSREAFSMLVARHLEPVRRYCSKLAGSPRIGEDLTQDTFLRLWRQRSTRTVGSFRKLLYTVATNVCRNAYRGSRRSARRESAQVHAPHTDEGLDEALAEVLMARIQAEVSELPEDQRTAVLLRYESGLSYAEVGEIAGCSEVTARSRVFHGLKRLREQFRDEELDR